MNEWQLRELAELTNAYRVISESPWAGVHQAGNKNEPREKVLDSILAKINTILEGKVTTEQVQDFNTLVEGVLHHHKLI